MSDEKQPFKSVKSSKPIYESALKQLEDINLILAYELAHAAALGGNNDPASVISEAYNNLRDLSSNHNP